MNWVVIDIETNGLDPNIHQPIEIALVADRGTPWYFSLEFDEASSDPKALEVNGYGKRAFAELYDDDSAAAVMRSVFQDRMLVASPAHFDIGMLAAWHRRKGYEIPWGHRNIIDLKSYALAKFGVDPHPLKNSVIGDVLGEPDTSDHSAAQDALWTARIWRKLLR